MPLRAVLDTNVVISALVFKQKKLANLRTAWQTEKFIPLVSRPTVLELLRVLAYPKFQLAPTEQEDLLADYLPYCAAIPMPETLPTVPDCRDPFDLPFLQLAVVGKADYLVTGDRDLLTFERCDNCQIVTPERFREQIK